MHRHQGLAPCLLSFVIIHAGCEQGGEPAPDPEASTNSLIVSLGSASTGDVTGVRFDVVGADQDCASTPISSEIAEIQAPAPGSSQTHAFASSLLLLAPGTYRVCATPLAGDVPSLDCAPVDALTTVLPEQTTELSLISQCKGDPTGAQGTIVTLNHPPAIQQLTIDPSDYFTVCETLHLHAAAADPEGDALTYTWTLTSGPSGAHLRGTDTEATLSGPEGDYMVELTVDDTHGGHASLSIPAHVSSATCSVSPEVDAIFVSNCSPCHTTNPTPSAGLRLMPADTAFANLVGQGVGSALCSDRTRVIPGDASASYLIAKLRGTAGICGSQMPRGRPPLPEEEIAIIEGWINGLPH